MSRSDWFIGLNERANKYLEDKVRWGKYQLIDDKGNVVQDSPRMMCTMGVKYTWTSMFGTENPLRVFKLKDGTSVYEKVQADPWASGPNFFTCLVDEKGKEISETLWTDEEIEANL